MGRGMTMLNLFLSQSKYRTSQNTKEIKCLCKTSNSISFLKEVGFSSPSLTRSTLWQGVDELWKSPQWGQCQGNKLWKTGPGGATIRLPPVSERKPVWIWHPSMRKEFGFFKGTVEEANPWNRLLEFLFAKSCPLLKFLIKAFHLVDSICSQNLIIIAAERQE